MTAPVAQRGCVRFGFLVRALGWSLFAAAMLFLVLLGRTVGA